MSNNKYYGYAGKILEIDLSSLSYEIRELPQKLVENYLGGKGFGAKLLYDGLKPGVEPLSEDNIIVFATGPLSGTLAPTEKIAVCTKSPLTGIWLDSSSGGYLGPAFKAAGYDVVIIKGKANKPCLIVIEDNSIKFKDAVDLWGKDTFSTTKIIKDELGNDIRIACIGPAGEKMIPLASILSEARAFGRGGAGAVLGSKNVKAIAVRGSNDINIYNISKFIRTNKEAYNEIAINPDTGGGRPKYGTNIIYSLINSAGIHPVKNFSQSIFENCDKLNEEIWVEKYWEKDKACHSCPIKCSKIARIKDGKYMGNITEGPEYENTWSLGAQCGVSDPDTIIYGEYLADYYGVDGISIGNIIGFAMECSEKGLIDEDVNFGDADKVIELIKDISLQITDLGKLLGQGVKRASNIIGHGSEKFAMHSKGLEFPAYEPRASYGMGLAYATSDRGACHLRAWPIKAEILNSNNRIDPLDTEYKAELVKNEQDLNALVDSLGMCMFATFALTPRQLVDLLYSLTGVDSFSSAEKLLNIGERIYNLTRLFNCREGKNREDDSLPYRQLYEPLPDGPAKGSCVKLEPMLEEYYLIRGWNKKGIPQKNKLKELKLEKIN